MAMQKFLRIWRLPILWATLIFLGSSIPSLKVTEDSLLQNIINITGHLVEYFVLTHLVVRAFSEEGLTIKRAIIYSVIATFIYAMLDETHQYFVPGRMMDIKDLYIDLFGSLIAVAIYRTRGYNKSKQL